MLQNATSQSNERYERLEAKLDSMSSHLDETLRSWETLRCCTCHMLHAVMLYATCYMLYTIYYLLYAM